MYIQCDYLPKSAIAYVLKAECDYNGTFNPVQQPTQPPNWFVAALKTPFGSPVVPPGLEVVSGTPLIVNRVQ